MNFVHVDLLISLQSYYKEAELCIEDCKESGADMKAEIQCAKAAVETAFSAYIDLLEDFRHASEKQLQQYSDTRVQNANKLRKLRQDFDVMTQNL